MQNCNSMEVSVSSYMKYCQSTTTSRLLQQSFCKWLNVKCQSNFDILFLKSFIPRLKIYLDLQIKWFSIPSYFSSKHSLLLMSNFWIYFKCNRFRLEYLRVLEWRDMWEISQLQMLTKQFFKASVLKNYCSTSEAIVMKFHCWTVKVWQTWMIKFACYVILQVFN